MIETKCFIKTLRFVLQYSLIVLTLVYLIGCFLWYTTENKHGNRQTVVARDRETILLAMKTPFQMMTPV